MIEVLEKTGHGAPADGDAATLVQRFWLNFIRSIAEPHLADEDANARRKLLEGRLAENVDKAVAAALEGRPPHKCGSFGRAALSVMRSRQKLVDGPVWIPDGPVRVPDGEGLPGGSL